MQLHELQPKSTSCVPLRMEGTRAKRRPCNPASQCGEASNSIQAGRCQFCGQQKGNDNDRPCLRTLFRADCQPKLTMPQWQSSSQHAANNCAIWMLHLSTFFAISKLEKATLIATYPCYWRLCTKQSRMHIKAFVATCANKLIVSLRLEAAKGGHDSGSGPRGGTCLTWQLTVAGSSKGHLFQSLLSVHRESTRDQASLALAAHSHMTS